MISKKNKIMRKFLLETVTVISTTMLMISYVPQIYITTTTQNVEGQSVMFWVLLSIACTGFFLQQVGLIKYENLKSKQGLIAQGFNALCAITMLVLTIIFR